MSRCGERSSGLAGADYPGMPEPLVDSLTLRPVRLVRARHWFTNAGTTQPTNSSRQRGDLSNHRFGSYRHHHRQRLGGQAATLVALLGICLQLGFQGRKLGERRVGVGLFLALAALGRLAAILVVVSLLLVMPMILAMVLPMFSAMVLGKGGRPVSGTPLAARFGTALALVARFRLIAAIPAKFSGRPAPAATVMGLLGLGSRFRGNGGRLGAGGRRGGTLPSLGGAIAAAVGTARWTAWAAALLAPAAGPPYLDEFRLAGR
jgi:hypothetical protein